MTPFAPWTEPIAARFAATRREIPDLATRIPNETWDTNSTVPGWAYRDILAHLAEGNFFCLAVLQAVIDGAETDMRSFSALKEQRIANALKRGRELSTDALIRKATQDGEETLALLSRLTEDDETRLVITSRTNPEPTTLAAFLSGYYHDEEHLAQLRTALPETSTIR